VVAVLVRPRQALVEVDRRPLAGQQHRPLAHQQLRTLAQRQAHPAAKVFRKRPRPAVAARLLQLPLRLASRRGS
jgi:hypothetical protein